VRRRVLLELATQGPQYLSEIARSVDVHVQNVRGALIGHGQRYKEGLALVSLDLAREREGPDGVRLFGVTDKGRRIARDIHDG